MQWLKLLHISCVIVSFSGFLMRGIWMINDSALLHKKWVKIFPHIIDSLLLISALLLVYVSALSVIENNWLIAKMGALIIYIFLGTVALKRGKTKKIKVLAFVLAIFVYLYIVSIALTKSVSGLVVLL